MSLEITGSVRRATRRGSGAGFSLALKPKKLKPQPQFQRPGTSGSTVGAALVALCISAQAFVEQDGVCERISFFIDRGLQT